MSAADSTARAALEFVKLGWWVFPVQGSSGQRPDDAKRPIKGLRWSQESTIDDQQVGFWFSGTNYGIGIDLGPSQLVVVDVDHPDKFDLDPALLAGAWVYRGNPERVSYMFSVPDGRTVPQAKHPWGEVKAAGGYVVGPPSFHPIGGAYEWLEQPGEQPGDASDALLAAIRPAPPKATSGPAWNGTKATKAQQEWVLGLLERASSRVAGAGQGQRNIQLNNAAMTMGHYTPHAIEESTVRQALMAAAKKCGLTRDDGERACGNTITSGLSAGMAQPQQPKSGGGLLFEDIEAPPEDFFEATPTLRHLRDYARAHRVSPWAMTACTMALVVAEAPPNLVLPDILGAEVSIALYVALVGPSGAGKSAAWGVANKALKYQQKAKEQAPGSGEGMIDAFLSIAGGKTDAQARIDDPWSAVVSNPHRIFWDDEITHMKELMNRQGSTLGSTLRTLWNGGSVGETNTHAGKRSRNLPAHAYRMALVVGIQPKLANVLLDDSDAGTPQRWLFVSVLDPYTLHPDESVDDPGPLPWSPPVVTVHRRELQAMEVCDEAVRLIRERHWLRQTGQAPLDDLDGHLLLTRLKVAAALALLHGDIEVTKFYWDLAGDFMEVSTANRERLQMGLVSAARERNRSWGAAEAERQMGKQARLTDEMDRWARKVWVRIKGPRNHSGAKHADDAPCTLDCARRIVKDWKDGPEATVGQRRDAVVERAIDHGWIVQDENRLLVGPESPDE